MLGAKSGHGDWPLIRPYRPGDRQAIRDICAATCWMGEHRIEMIGDDWVWAEFWTRYFTDVERDLTWVVQDAASGQVVGYLTGTRDASRFDSYTRRLLPGIVWRVIRERLMRRALSRRAILSMLGMIAQGDMAVSPAVRRRYGATCHIDLLPQARWYGLGGKLLDLFVGRLRRLGVPGLHTQTLSLNRIAVLMRRKGLTLAVRRPVRAFAHFESRDVDVLTWVLDLKCNPPEVPK